MQAVEKPVPYVETRVQERQVQASNSGDPLGVSRTRTGSKSQEIYTDSGGTTKRSKKNMWSFGFCC